MKTSKNFPAGNEHEWKTGLIAFSRVHSRRNVFKPF